MKTVTYRIAHRILLFVILASSVALFQNCGGDVDLGEYGDKTQTSTEQPAPEEPPPPPPVEPPPPPPPASEPPPPPPPPTFKDYGGATGPGDLSPNVAFENKSDSPFQSVCKTSRRFLVNNTQASINRRCQELGWDYGMATEFYSFNEWCYYCNAGTRTWNGTSWTFGSCVNGNVKAARCFKN